MTLLKSSRRMVVLLLAVMLVLLMTIFQMFRSVNKSVAIVEATNRSPEQTALLVGKSSRKLSFVLTSYPEMEQPVINEKVIVVLPNKAGEKNQRISGTVVANESVPPLSLIKLDKKVRQHRALQFKTEQNGMDLKGDVLVRNDSGKRLSDYEIVAQKEGGTGGTPILTEKEEVIGLYAADKTIISAKEAVSFLSKQKVTVHTDGSNKQELLVSTFAALNVVVLYVLLLYWRRKKS
ncbi:hypothetical protein I6N95_25905 [Vagococcus sp. BWB3-3]|uniref:Uncharacterized protein n=1 Tax=Vagococcus allomyrinae TaxID=2794353 RepID=A0A940PGZ5_9ENTE|nr:hypothetical protein [Vagococcus allomyrinae]MBP1044447.1 hypothetical protein [Vagococcus allomyrinae]